jgi:ribosomal protein S18 acetylase RimI-like enzyme
MVSLEDYRMVSPLAKQGRLTPFERAFAPLMLGWVRDEEELFWLAPQTTGPLTVPKIEAWTRPEDHPYLYWTEDARAPIGYGELNHMPNRKSHLWLGHLIVAPAHRGQGWGRTLVMALFEEAFGRLRAKEVSLVVFPDNEPAVRCYRRCGMSDLGIQYKIFGTQRRRYGMLHMALSVKEYARLVRRDQEAQTQNPPG